MPERGPDARWHLRIRWALYTGRTLFGATEIYFSLFFCLFFSGHRRTALSLRVTAPDIRIRISSSYRDTNDDVFEPERSDIAVAIPRRNTARH